MLPAGSCPSYQHKPCNKRDPGMMPFGLRWGHHGLANPASSMKNPRRSAQLGHPAWEMAPEPPSQPAAQTLLHLDSAGAKPRVILLADSDAESSSAGSSDEEDVLAAEPSGALGERIVPPPAEGHGGSNSTSRKILRFVDKIAKSKYFQKATENEFIKKKIEEVSNTPLLLTVEVQELSGTLAVNIPPPPTDRIWYSFRIPPQLELKVHPKLGEREVTFIHVTEWIERKLQHEFQKILVMPNMDDLIIPIMHSGLEPQPPLEGPFKDLPADSGKWL